MAQLNDISCYKGEAVTLGFTMTPVTDITNWAIVLTVKRNQTDVAAVLTKNATLTVAANGTFSIALTKNDTNIPAAIYQYDVQRVDTGSEAVLSIGSFTVQQEVRN